jgi:hypothetical protein
MFVWCSEKMTISLRFVVLVFLVGQMMFSFPCQAAKWREVGEVPDSDAIVSVDETSISVDHEYIVTGWVKFEYDKPRERDGYQVTGYVTQRMVNCEVNRYWLMDGWGYPPNGAEPVRLYSTIQEWQMPPPDSESEIASAALCYEAKSVFGMLWDTLQIFQRLKLVWDIISAKITQ